MFENALHALVRSTLLAALTGPYAGVQVKRLFQPTVVGVPSGPTIFTQTIMPGHRVGWVRRTEIQPVPPATDMTHRETQWWETTLQIGALHRLTPEQVNAGDVPSANDIARKATDILQSESGMLQLAAARVRPLRITDVRNVQITNDSAQYEDNPSFDIVLSYVQITDSTTPPVTLGIVPRFGRV